MRPRSKKRKKAKVRWQETATPEKLAYLLGYVRDEQGQISTGASDVIAGYVEKFIAAGKDDDARTLLDAFSLCRRHDLWNRLRRIPGADPASPVSEIPIPAEPNLFKQIHPLSDQAVRVEELLAYEWLHTGQYDPDLAHKTLQLACRHLFEMHRLVGRSEALHSWLVGELSHVGFQPPPGREFLGTGFGGTPFYSEVQGSLQIARLLLNLGLFSEVRRWLVGTTYLLFLSLDKSYEPRMSFDEFLLDPAARSAEIDRRGGRTDDDEPWFLDQARMLQMLATSKLKGVPPLEEARSVFSTWLDWTADAESQPFYSSTRAMCLFVLLGRVLCPEVEPFEVIRDLIS